MYNADFQKQQVFNNFASAIMYLINIYEDENSFQKYMDEDYPFECSLDEVINIDSELFTNCFIFSYLTIVDYKNVIIELSHSIFLLLKHECINELLEELKDFGFSKDSTNEDVLIKLINWIEYLTNFK